MLSISNLNNPLDEDTVQDLLLWTADGPNLFEKTKVIECQCKEYEIIAYVSEDSIVGILIQLVE